MPFFHIYKWVMCVLVAINSSGGGSDNGISSNGIVEKNFTLELSNKINDILKSKGIKTYMLRSDDSTISYENRLKNLKSVANGEDVLLISNTLNTSSGIDIIYALKDSDSLASILNDSLSYFNTTKYYQLRNTTNTTKDYYYITRETPDYETIIIRYGNPSYSSDLKVLKNVDELADAVSDAIISYLGVNNNNYVVKSGDTLYSIAKKFNISVDKLKDMNNLTSNLIKINQVLVIPSNTYTVKAGDTLYSIAKKYNTTVSKLMELNNLKNSNLSIGDILYLD